MSRFAINLRVLRNILNVPAQTVSDKLGIKAGTYRAWEEGRCQPDAAMLIKISELHEVSLTDLIKNDLSKKKPEQTRDHFIISRYNVADDNIKKAIDLMLKIV
mgnify:CR=1 FL=1